MESTALQFRQTQGAAVQCVTALERCHMLSLHYEAAGQEWKKPEKRKSIFIEEYYVRRRYEWQGGSESYMFWQNQLWLFFDEDEWSRPDWVAGLDPVYLEDCHAASSSIRLLINHLKLQHRATNINLGRE